MFYRVAYNLNKAIWAKSIIGSPEHYTKSLLLRKCKECFLVV